VDYEGEGTGRESVARGRLNALRLFFVLYCITSSQPHATSAFATSLQTKAIIN